jgi:CBS domain-containing protein
MAPDDVFCYELPVPKIFLHLTAEERGSFNLFCTQYIASLLKQSRQQLQLAVRAARWPSSRR